MTSSSNSNSQEPTLPITNSGIHNSNPNPGVLVQIGDSLKSVRIVAWFISIVEFFSNYTDVSPINVHVREASDGMNSITSNFQSQEVAKLVVGLVMPIAGLLLNYSILQSGFITIVLYFGLVATFHGMLFKGMYPRAASVMEKLGVALNFLSFFRITSLSLSPALEWVSWVCFTLICVPLVLSLVPINSTAETNTADPPNNMV